MSIEGKLPRPCNVVARLLGACVLAVALSSQARAATVLTATQATYSIAMALTQDTSIEVSNVPEDGRQLSLLKDYIGRRMERLTPIFRDADAVISMTNALPGDPLYRYAREANVRVVDIDAAVPWALDSPGVALADAPLSDVGWAVDTDVSESATAPYFWLSVSNAIRMADLVAHDFAQLYPADADAISANLERFKQELLALRNEYQTRLIEAASDTVFALTGDFVYLTNDMGLFVDGYFIKQDIRWTQADLAALTRHLMDRDVRVVIHKWEPSEEIRAAIAAAGATLVVLDTADPGIVVDRRLAADGLQQVLRSNLEAVSAALSR